MSMVNPILLPELRLMLAENDEQGLRDVVSELHPATVADFTEGLSVDETWEVLSHAPLSEQAEVFSYYSPAKQVALVQGAGKERMSALLEVMAPDNRVELLKRLDPELVDDLMPLVAKAERHDIRMLLSYPEHSAGAVMTTEYATLPADVTAAEAISRLRMQAPSNEMIYYIYVTDSARHLLGSVSLRDLILAKPSTLVSDLMERNVITVRVDEDQEQVAAKLARYDFLAIPVVDLENRLVGIVTHDDVMDVMVEEATEDAHRMGAVDPLDESYLDSPFVTIWRKRFVWLACLFIAELFTYTALSQFEDQIAKLVVLSLFVPLCISTGGNSGSQAATLITRAMALGQVRSRDWWRVLKHELGMGLALGLTLGMIGLVRGSLTGESRRDSSLEMSESFHVRLPSTAPFVNDNQGRILLPPGAVVSTDNTLKEQGHIRLPQGAKPPAPDPKDPLFFQFPAKSVVSLTTVSAWSLALVIGFSVAAICLWGTIVGAMLPLVFKHLGFDPGYASSPFVATFVDVTGIVIYFNVAQVFLSIPT